MENFTQVASTTTLRDARQQFLDNDISNRSNSSGVAFPTTNLYVGMFCFRTDDGGLYQLKSIAPDTWVKLFDIDTARASDSELLDGQEGSFYQNADNLNAGTVPNARISGSYTNFVNITGSGIADFARFLGNTGDTAALPSFSFTLDSNSGMWSPGADQLGFSTAGVNRLTLTTTGFTSTVNVTAPTFVGALSGNATTATTATNAALVATNATAAVHYPLFAAAATGNQPARTDTDYTYNPSTNTLTVANLTGTASNSNQLNGFGSDTAASGNTVMRRDANGYAYATYLNQSSANNENAAVSQILTSNGTDNFLRKSSVAHLAAAIRAAETTTISKSLTLTANWIDAGISSTNIPVTGTYAVSLYANDSAVGGGHFDETYSGVMTWFAAATNSGDVDEIILHKAGHASNAREIHLRTVRTASGVLKLQISGDGANSGASTYTFKFRLLIA